MHHQDIFKKFLILQNHLPPQNPFIFSSSYSLLACYTFPSRTHNHKTCHFWATWSYSWLQEYSFPLSSCWAGIGLGRGCLRCCIWVGCLFRISWGCGIGLGPFGIFVRLIGTIWAKRVLTRSSREFRRRSLGWLIWRFIEGVSSNVRRSFWPRLAYLRRSKNSPAFLARGLSQSLICFIFLWFQDRLWGWILLMPWTLEIMKNLFPIAWFRRGTLKTL